MFSSQKEGLRVKNIIVFAPASRVKVIAKA